MNVLMRNRWTERIRTKTEMVADPISALLAMRAITDPEERETFLNPSEKQLHDPFLFRDMELAVTFILQCLERQGKILIYGDYDCDGLTSAALLARFFKRLNARTEIRIPDRLSEGYGLSLQVCREIIEAKPDLLITVDCGSSSRVETHELMAAGIPVIVTDHHEVPELCAEPLAMINPHRKGETYPFPNLAGVGVAFKLASAVAAKIGLQDWPYGDLLSLAALGTVADNMPLLGENRVLVSLGLSTFPTKAPQGLRIMAEQQKMSAKPDASFFSFSIAPRLNAAGRMGRCEPALNLLLTEERNEAEVLLAELEELNRKRREEEMQIFIEADLQIRAMPSEERQGILIVADRAWHPGVAGIVSARLVERYSRPVITFAENGGEWRGSARSVGDFDILSAISFAKEHCLTYGGHLRAAGVSLAEGKLDAFKRKILEYSQAHMQELLSYSPSIPFDLPIRSEAVNDELFFALQALAPFGNANEEPVFFLTNLTLTKMRPVGNDLHLAITVKLEDGREISGIAFKKGDFTKIFRCGDKVELLCTLNWHEWNERASLQLMVLDLRAPEYGVTLWDKPWDVEADWQKGLDADSLAMLYRMNPVTFRLDRGILGQFASYLSQEFEENIVIDFDVPRLARAAARAQKVAFNPFLLFRMLEVLDELGMLKLTRLQEARCALEMQQYTGGFNALEQLSTWRHLCEKGVVRP